MTSRACRCLASESETEKLRSKNAEMRRKMDDSMAALQELGRENQTLQVRAGARVSGEPDAAGACGSMGGAKTNH